MEDRLESRDEKFRDKRDPHREEPAKPNKRVPLSVITKEQHGEENVIGEPASKGLKPATQLAFKDRTNFEDHGFKAKPGDLAMQEELKFKHLDCPGESLEQATISSEMKEEALASRRRPEQYVEDLQPEIFDYCMRNEVAAFYED